MMLRFNLLLAVGVSVVCLTASVARAADIVAVVTANPDPAPGLTSVTVSAFSAGGEDINSFAGISISNPVHNVFGGFAPPAVTADQWDPAGGAGLAAWNVFDTYVLFDFLNDLVGAIGGPLGEGANDNSDPAGLGLINFGQPATTGLSTFGHPASTDQFVIIPGLASDNVPFLQVVYPTAGPVPTLSMTFFDVLGQPSEISGVPLTAIPEPATLALGLLGLVGLVSLRRRSV